MNPGPVCRLDLSGTVTLANKAAKTLFGQDSLMGKCWLDVCPQMTRSIWSSVLKEETPVQHEADFGSHCILFTHVCTPARDAVFVFGSDVTSLRLAERQLKKQADELAEYARFPEMNPGPVLRLNDDSAVLLANAAARRIFGDAVVDARWRDLCPGLTERLWKRILATPKPVAHETNVGTHFYMFTHQCDVKTHLVFVFGTDITEKKLAEKALQQSEKMATLGTLAAGIAHELNNPASATQRASDQLREGLTRLIVSHLRLAMLDLPVGTYAVLEQLEQQAVDLSARPFDLDPVTRSDLESQTERWLEEKEISNAPVIAPLLAGQNLHPARLAELESKFQKPALDQVINWTANTFRVFSLLNEISQGSARISEIVGAMKGYSFVGQAPVRMIDVHEGLDNTLVILSNKLKPGVTVQREYDASLPKLTAYGSELNQVWTNLIDNAVDAMDGRGTLTIRTSRNHEAAIVEIEDNGPGIMETIQSQIFDPFFTTKEPGKGTGLGLWMTFKIIREKHNGEIAFESRPGKTVFKVKLPMKGPESPE